MRRDVILLLLVVILTLVAALDFRFPSNPLNLAVVFGIPIVMVSFLGILVYEQTRLNRKHSEHLRRLRSDGREPRYIDETLDLPANDKQRAQ